MGNLRRFNTVFNYNDDFIQLLDAQPPDLFTPMLQFFLECYNICVKVFRTGFNFVYRNEGKSANAEYHIDLI